MGKASYDFLEHKNANDVNTWKDCKKRCAGDFWHPYYVNVPLPNCKEYCYTTSKAENALENCTKRCGTGIETPTNITKKDDVKDNILDTIKSISK